MTLKAIIFRADGVIAETEDIRRSAFAAVFAEAGFPWCCDRARFALTAALGSGEARMAHYVRQSLKGRPETEDFSLLIGAMHRRAKKIFGEMIEQGSVTARPFVRDLIVAARGDGLRVVISTSLPKRVAAGLICAVAGSRVAELVELVAHYDGCGEVTQDDDLYSLVREALGMAPGHAIVIEATAAGAEAARNYGFPVITTRSACGPPDASFVDGSIVVDNLGDLIAGRGIPPQEPLSKDQREDLLAALQRLHLGNCENLSELARSNQMRVSDILKTKGATVKTVAPDATVQAFAHGLRVEGVGAMPVIDGSGMLHGIISERDLARGIADYGSDLPGMRVSDLMTRSVVTCRPEDSVAAVAGVMSQRRIRHLPVMVKGALVGMISIGDVLKHRLDEVQLEASVLRDFALSRR